MVVVDRPKTKISFMLTPIAVQAKPIKRKEVFNPRSYSNYDDVREVTLHCLHCKDMFSAEGKYANGQLVRVLTDRKITNYAGRVYHSCGGLITVFGTNHIPTFTGDFHPDH